MARGPVKTASKTPSGPWATECVRLANTISNIGSFTHSVTLEFKIKEEF